MTSRPLSEAPEGVTPWQGDDVAPLLTALPGTIWLVGGAQAVQSFLAARLIDRMRLFVIPRLLGRGIRLFDRGESIPAPLPLLAVRSFDTGVVELEYGQA